MAALRVLCVVAVVGAAVALPFVSFSNGVAAAAPLPVQLFAAPNGSGGVCTQLAPCSLAGARSSVRSLDGAMTSDIDVLLENGTYTLTSPLSFGPQDSGTNGFDVVYEAAPGAHPVLSGGAPVTGWHQVDTTKDIWAAPIPSGFDTGQLYVNGQRVPRAQGLPAAYYLQTTTGFIASSSALAGWRDITNVSAVFKGGNGAWTQTSCPIASVKGNVITMQQPCWGNLHLPADGLPGAGVDLRAPRRVRRPVGRGAADALRERVRAAEPGALDDRYERSTRCSTSRRPVRTWRRPPSPCRPSSRCSTWRAP